MSNEIINFNPKNVKPVEIRQGDFDFDYWSKLAKKDPEAFEAAREAEINKHIESLDEDVQERMRRLQWRIEMERKRSKNPMDAAGRIYDMMWESVGQSIKALDELTALLNPQSTMKKAQTEKQETSNVLSFDRKDAEIATVD